jgi:outer membrane protein assembly factor BamD
VLFNTQIMIFRNAAVAAVLTSALLGCSSGLGNLLGGEDKSVAAEALASDGAALDDGAVAKVYNDALSSMNAGNYRSAAKKFGEVERRYPYSKWATKSLLMQAYTHYQGNSFDDSINSAKRFIALHPGHKDAPYAYYLISLSEYEQIRDTRRDQSQTQRALDALEEVERRFPDSQYAPDVKKRANLARDQLAAKEMEVGRFYLKRGSYLAGINRFKKVVTDYQTTTHTPEALYRLAEGYMALGVISEAQTAAAILGHNFPKSNWYRDAYALVSSDGKAPVANSSSWLSKVFGGFSG